MCTEKCPSRKAPNEFNMGLNNRGAVYIPFAQAIPNVPVIDPEYCIKLKTGKCGLCEKNCTAKAMILHKKKKSWNGNTVQLLPQRDIGRFPLKILRNLDTHRIKMSLPLWSWSV